MAVELECPRCRRKLRVPDSAAGRRGKCPSCGAFVDVPALSQLPARRPSDIYEDTSDSYSPDGDEIRYGQQSPISDEAPGAAGPDPIWPAPPAIAAASQLYVYKMIQIPPDIEVGGGTSTAGRAADYLEGVVNEYAAKGWEFFRVDEIGIRIKPGGLASLFGARGRRLGYHVVTFRRPRGG